MSFRLAITVLSSAALALAQAQVQVQGPAPDPVLLTSTKASVLPVAPTPFNGVLTLEGTIIDKGPSNPGFAGLNGPAIAQLNQPETEWKATLPGSMFNPNVGGLISGTIGAVGTDQGVQITVNFSGFPAVSTYGPFGYHIHGMPVSADGNCTNTLAHLDPTNRGEYWPCDTTNPQNCQAGDLAGKHGKINGTSFTATYLEPYLSLDPMSPYFLGNGSIVIHTANTTRLTCANFSLVAANGSMTTPNSTASRVGPTPTATPSSVPSNDASSISGSFAAVAAAVAIAFLA